MDSLCELFNSNEKRYLEFLSKLINFDTSVIRHGEEGQEQKAQEFLASYLKKMGCQIDMFEPDNEVMKNYPSYNEGHKYTGRPVVVATYKGSGGGKSLILNGHMDTMPSGDLNKWNTNPWKMTEKNGYLYGLGTDDMKGGLSAEVLGLELALSTGFKPKGDIIIESVVDEEGGGNGSLAVAAAGYRADAAIIAEGTHLNVFTANRGAWLVQVEIEGQPIHASLRGFGQNAIEKAVKVINSLHELETKWLTTKVHPLLSPPTINIGCIQGGVAASTVPENCVLKFDVEFFPSEINIDGERIEVTKESVVKEVEDHLNLMASGDVWLKEHPLKFTWYQDCPPFETDIKHPIVATSLDIANTVTDNKSTIGGLSCGCDARHLVNIAKTPTIIFGPGTCHHAHVVNEYLPKKEYLKAIEGFAKIIMEWTK
jgi:acetylornithine deacetylase